MRHDQNYIIFAHLFPQDLKITVWYSIKMVSDDMFDFKGILIEEIKLYPAIYDKANLDHSCRNKKDAIFEAIRAALGVTGKFYFFMLNQTHGNNRKVSNKLINKCKISYKYQLHCNIHM